MRYVVISGNTSDDEMFVDYVSARSKDAAMLKVATIRGEETDGHLAVDRFSVFSAADLRRMAVRLETGKPSFFRHWFDAVKKELKEE